MTDRLQALWDFGDLDASEQRFRARLEEETSPAGRAEVLTQLARVEGLRGRFAEGDRLLDEAEDQAAESSVARARVLVERGRLRRSSGDPASALPLFESAFAVALDAGEEFIAADAAHMAAIAAPDEKGMRSWTQRGIELGERSPEAAYWLGPLLNNLGWSQYEAAEYEQALDTFTQALAAREREPQRGAQIEIARYAVGRTLRMLGRPAEAAALLEQAVSWAQSAGDPDGWFHEELAENYAALGRLADAREHARVAIPLLDDADPSFAERADRLRALAGV